MIPCLDGCDDVPVHVVHIFGNTKFSGILAVPVSLPFWSITEIVRWWLFHANARICFVADFHLNLGLLARYCHPCLEIL